MTAAGDAWLAEMWKPCRELSRAERMAQREADRKGQRKWEERLINSESAPVPTLSPAVEEVSTSCAETGPNESPERGTRCA